MNIPAWAVGAAILKLDYPNGLSIYDLTEQVMNTGLSGLGLEGDTPTQTLRSQLAYQSPIEFEIMENHVRLMYPEDWNNHTDVEIAVFRLKELRKSLPPSGSAT